MQKFVISLFVIILLFFNIPAQKVAFDFDGTYTFYTKSQPANNMQVTKCGSLYFVSCDKTNAKQVLTQLKGVVGQSVKFCGDKQLFNKVVKKLGKADCYHLQNLVVAEGFCQWIDGCVTSKNKKINFQVAFDGEYIVVGTPTILSGF